jgi:creatinine amidohydrolase
MDTEVRYHMLRPAEIVARRNEAPVAYLPIGGLEWHGIHNAPGADTLQAEGLALALARRGGGLVFPPLYYGESRSEALMEANAADREAIAAGMDLAPENFSLERQPFSPMEQMINYQKLLLHILAEIQSLGFRLGVIVAGHYPLIDHANAAVSLFNQQRFQGSLGAKRQKMLAWALVDYQFCRDAYGETAGDHAGGWETSHMMALHPQTVDLSLLPEKGQKLVGAGGHMAPQDSTAAFGQETIDHAVERILPEVRHRLENPGAYTGHGRSLKTGAWREET